MLSEAFLSTSRFSIEGIRWSPHIYECFPFLSEAESKRPVKKSSVNNNAGELKVLENSLDLFSLGMHSVMFDSAQVRGALRCYIAIDRVEDRAVVFLAKSSLWVKSERSWRRQRLCSFIFFNTSLSSGKNLRARSHEKKRVELNQTALLVGDIFSHLGRPRNDGRHQGLVFFFGPFYKRVARGAFSLTFTCRTILPLSFGSDFQCIHVHPSSRARLELVQWSSPRRSFAKMLWRTSLKQSLITAGSRWQCSRLICGRSSDAIAEETDSSPDPEEERQQHSCSSLLSIFLTSEFAHTTLTVTGTLKHVKSSVARSGGIVLRWSSGYGAGG